MARKYKFEWVATIIMISFAKNVLPSMVNNSVTLDNVYCAPYVDYVKTDPHSNQYFPYMVELHRCKGSWKKWSLSFIDCAPTEDGIQIIDVHVSRVENRNIDLTIAMVNHTDCTKRCVKDGGVCTSYEKWNNEQCRCECKHEMNSNPPCSEGKIWRGCDCVCPPGERHCGYSKVWSNDSCSCVCQERDCQGDFDEDTCQCLSRSTRPRRESSSSVSTGFFIMALIVEAFMSLFLVLVFYNCIYARFCLHKYEDERHEDLDVRIDRTYNDDLHLSKIVSSGERLVYS